MTVVFCVLGLVICVLRLLACPSTTIKPGGTIALVNHAKTRSLLYLASPHGPNHCHHQFCTAAWCNRVTLHTFLLTVFFQEASLLQVSPRDNSPSLVAGFNPSPRNYDHQHPISRLLVETKHRTPQPALASGERTAGRSVQSP